MKIRTRLTLRFIFIAAIIVALALVLVYVLSAEYREDDFFNRLRNKANNTAKLLIEVDEVDANLLRRIEQDNPVSLPYEKIMILNYKDTVLFSTDEGNELKISDELVDRIRLEDEIGFIQGDYEVLGFLFKGQFDRFVVIAAAKDIYGFKRLHNLRFILLFVFAVSIVIVSVSAWIYAGKALQPIAKIVKEVDEISISNLNFRLDEGNRRDEIAKLSQTFNDMLSRLETSFRAQKNFISNASHELRTPLTSITGQLEVLQLNTRSPEEYQKVINSVLEDIRNLNALSNRLLLLAQTSTAERENKMIPLRIDELVWLAREDLTKHYPSFIVFIDMDESLDDEKKLTILGDEHLIKTAFINLIENGCKYSLDHKTNVFIKVADGFIELKVTDNGIGIPPDELPNVYQPFFRGANTSNTRGHGIGLSMVKGILRLHNAEISIDSKIGEGTEVIVRFPSTYINGYG